MSKIIELFLISMLLKVFLFFIQKKFDEKTFRKQFSVKSIIKLLLPINFYLEIVKLTFWDLVLQLCVFLHYFVGRNANIALRN